jgi:hypothetical protein
MSQNLPASRIFWEKQNKNRQAVSEHCESEIEKNATAYIIAVR